MHVPDGFINAPVSTATGLISLGTIWAYIRNAKNLVADRLIALTGMMSALIFVLQMINFPIAAGTSGHLLGDGGLSALGVNLLNMAVVTSLIGWLVISTWKKLFNESYSSIISGSFIAGLLSVVFSSIAFVLEYAIGGTVAVPLGSVLIAMVSSHVLIGIGEGIITGLIVSLLLRVRSDLVYVNQNKEIKNNATSFYGIFILLILLLTLITPYASSSPDGLESVAESYGFNEESGIVLFLDDYGITNINNNFLSTVLSAVLGIVVIVGLFNIYIKVKNKN